MKNKEFLEFLKADTEIPTNLKSFVRKEIGFEFRKRSILMRFLALQIIGALFSMSVCPQFGLGLVEGHGISHFFRMISDSACAAFCGSLFLSSGLILAFIGMPGEELHWVWRKYKMPLIFLPAIFWSLLMFFNLSFSLPKENYTYHVVWLSAAILAQYLLLKVKNSIHVFKRA